MVPSNVSALEGSTKVTNTSLYAFLAGISQISMANLLEAPIDPRTELDSHANMVVLGKNCFIFDRVEGRYCEVAPYDPSIGTVKKVPVVDALIAYDCPYSHESYLLIVQNT